MVGRHFAYFWLRITLLRPDPQETPVHVLSKVEGASLAAQMVHEVNQPLAAMRLTLEDMAGSAAGAPRERAVAGLIAVLERVEQGVASTQAGLTQATLPVGVALPDIALADWLEALQKDSPVTVTLPSPALLRGLSVPSRLSALLTSLLQVLHTVVLPALRRRLRPHPRRPGRRRPPRRRPPYPPGPTPRARRPRRRRRCNRR